ncbi:Abi family protein [Arthrobacter sp. StoSoilB5]|uniref:Abi family protein n=1 Tax=Arthrobacter sp. StoSoilB5 TaxID=2830992 RepID=UPI001CC4AC5F|nr:Abi family protein [Arthrobacter sp. StoSoilB5]BCW46982.1 abi family protein [Arthrobacter sp. StoSoilB5]
MADYRKQWLSVEEQIQKLASRGVAIPNDGSGVQLLRAIGYYRLTGYLYPFRNSEFYLDQYGRRRLRVLNNYRDGTSLEDAAAIIDFDRKLRMLILDGIERIEVSLRMQIGYTLGCRSAFAHLEPVTFVSAFTNPPIDDCTGQVGPSKHELWIARMRERQNASDEAFVAHFRDNYDGRMPIWAATEIMEMGHLSRLYSGLVSSIATEIALAYGAPSKRVMNSWIASLNYVRNVAAHHARIFNRKLVTAPKRPGKGTVPILDHLLDETSSKQVFGLYNALAVMAYLLRAIDEDADWTRRVVELVKAFPTAGHLTEESMGMPEGWAGLELWKA